MSKRLAVALLLLTAACDGSDDELVVRGWVEGREVDVGPMTSGRLLDVRVEEGDTVEAGDTIALLSRDATAAEAAVARARVDAASARLREVERGARAEDVAAARADLEGAEAEYARAARELRRVESLDTASFVSAQELDDMRTAVLRAASRRDVAREALARLRAGATREQVDAARSELAAARAALTGAESIEEELLVIAPVSGPVLLRAFEPGEIVAAGAPLVTLLAGNERWVRVWLPQRALGAVTTGTPARVRIDGIADATFDATVTAVAMRAEFTPRVALTEDERADLMYAVRLRVDDPSDVLRVGLPVEARFGVVDDE